jgi:hypothetical protein
MFFIFTYDPPTAPWYSAVPHPRQLMGPPRPLPVPTAPPSQRQVEASSSYSPPVAAAAPSCWKPTALWWADSDPQEHPARLPSPSPTAQPSSASPQGQHHPPADPSAAAPSTLAHACFDPQHQREDLSAMAAGLSGVLWAPS